MTGAGIITSLERGSWRAYAVLVAFALMAYQTWNRRPSSLSSATGAKRSSVLGKISYP